MCRSKYVGCLDTLFYIITCAQLWCRPLEKRYATPCIYYIRIGHADMGELYMHVVCLCAWFVYAHAYVYMHVETRNLKMIINDLLKIFISTSPTSLITI